MNVVRNWESKLHSNDDANFAHFHSKSERLIETYRLQVTNIATGFLDSHCQLLLPLSRLTTNITTRSTILLIVHVITPKTIHCRAIMKRGSWRVNNIDCNKSNNEIIIEERPWEMFPICSIFDTNNLNICISKRNFPMLHTQKTTVSRMMPLYFDCGRPSWWYGWLQSIVIIC